MVRVGLEVIGTFFFGLYFLLSVIWGGRRFIVEVSLRVRIVGVFFIFSRYVDRGLMKFIAVLFY